MSMPGLGWLMGTWYVTTSYDSQATERLVKYEAIKSSRSVCRPTNLDVVAMDGTSIHNAFNDGIIVLNGINYSIIHFSLKVFPNQNLQLVGKLVESN